MMVTMSGIRMRCGNGEDYEVGVVGDGRNKGDGGTGKVGVVDGGGGGGGAASKIEERRDPALRLIFGAAPSSFWVGVVITLSLSQTNRMILFYAFPRQQPESPLGVSRWLGEWGDKEKEWS